MSSEYNELDSLAVTANYSRGIMRKTIEYCTSIFLRFLKSGSVLELGPAEGVMTDVLVRNFPDYTIVDGAISFVNSIILRHKNVKGYRSLIEEIKFDRRFDNIIIGHVMEHVDNPKIVLKKLHSILEDDGIILCAVPNANSIHRVAGVLMNLLDAPTSLNNTDISNGHKRVYDLDTLKKEFLDSDFRILHVGGYWLKPFSHQQIEKWYDTKLIETFLKLGEVYPDIAGEIYLIATKNNNKL
jgi:2-polyprenyl-3-methyl-5-hydroxy-6-metoxy-1,4-benzoquinol methylase